MKQWWQCTIITMYENLRLCTLLFLTLLLAYGNSGSSNHNLSLLILVIRECILNLLKSCDQGSSRRTQKWQSGNSRIILTLYLNPRRIFYFFSSPEDFFLKSHPISHSVSASQSLSLWPQIQLEHFFTLQRNSQAPVETWTTEMPKISCVAELETRKLENKQKKIPNP